MYHYIDDFFGGAPKSDPTLAHRQFNSVILWFDRLGIPTQPNKCVAPDTSMKILGFVYDTKKQMVFILN